MAVRADHFKVKSIRPVAGMDTDEVPEDLMQRLLGRTVSADELEGLGADVNSANLYHGGDSLVVIYWGSGQYALDLDPVT